MRFKHRGLRDLYHSGDGRRLSPNHIARLQRILTALENATNPAEANRPGFHLHPLKGSDRWSVRVSANWRVVFRFVDGEAVDVDYLDYH